jgi:hypothetical protein
MRLKAVGPIVLVAVGLAGCAPVSPMDVSSRDARAGAERDAVDRPSVCSTVASAQRVSRAKGYVDRLQALLETVRARKAAGAASATDVAQVQARLADARARLARAQADLRIARAELAAATGRSGRCPTVP